MNTQDKQGPTPTNQLPADYVNWLASLKSRVQVARQSAALAVNAELIGLYWHIGQEILERQSQQGWGTKVIDRLAKDLREAFPDFRGFSAGNLRYMRTFAQAWAQEPICEQLVRKLPWGHNILLLNRLHTPADRVWYAQQAIAGGWSRSTLEANIRDQLQQRSGTAATNFEQRLPAPNSELARQTLKDPYLFQFLGLGNEANEHAIEDGLVAHITRFLLELGTGFAFIDRQYRLEVGEKEYFIDLLFYHTRLKCYVVVELKSREFKPADAGQLNFYVEAIDRQVRAPDDHPTIGLLLCRTRDRTVAEYALAGINKPMGVAEYRLLPDQPELPAGLPTVAQLESELAEVPDEPGAYEEPPADA